ncbi:MAG TPA: hypothetical protein VJO34_04400, partial [Methylomirabilota bacterium]|nr:hypothetical protein [Methylomirabilota bacterium]
MAPQPRQALTQRLHSMRQISQAVIGAGNQMKPLGLSGSVPEQAGVRWRNHFVPFALHHEN